jgi:magnesium chelatase family protein
MSIANVVCRAQLGLHAPLVQVEVSLDSGLPNFSIVGLAATVVKESKDRVRAAIVNSNFEFPAGRITINLSPADIPKRGGRFDLPIALGILLASGQVKMDPESRIDPGHREFFGELGLNGELRSVPGMLQAAAHAARMGHEVIVPDDNADEVRLLLGTAHGDPDLSGADRQSADSRQQVATRGGRRRRTGPTLRAAGHLLAVCAHLDGSNPIPPLTPRVLANDGHATEPELDLRDVRGQIQAKRALTIAAAGGHSVLMRGPPGNAPARAFAADDRSRVTGSCSNRIRQRHRLQCQQLRTPSDANATSHCVRGFIGGRRIRTATWRNQPRTPRRALSG